MYSWFLEIGCMLKMIDKCFDGRTACWVSKLKFCWCCLLSSWMWPLYCSCCLLNLLILSKAKSYRHLHKMHYYIIRYLKNPSNADTRSQLQARRNRVLFYFIIVFSIYFCHNFRVSRGTLIQLIVYKAYFLFFPFLN